MYKRILDSAIRSPESRRPAACIVAAIATAILLATAAALVRWLFPAGCDIRGDPATYRWTCLLPGLLIVVPAAVATLLLIADFLNYKTARRVPDGWLVAIVGAGLLTQVVVVGGYSLALDPAYRSQMLIELVSVPQPFVAGAVSAAVFRVTLHLATRSPLPTMRQ